MSEIPEPEADRDQQQIEYTPEQQLSDNKEPGKSSRTRKVSALQKDYELTGS